MEGFSTMALRVAKNASENYVTPTVDRLSAAIQQIQSSALVQSACSHIANFAATPLGMGLIGTVALAAFLGAVILIGRRWTEGSAQSEQKSTDQAAKERRAKSLENPTVSSTTDTTLALQSQGKRVFSITQNTLYQILAHFNKAQQRQLAQILGQNSSNVEIVVIPENNITAPLAITGGEKPSESQKNISDNETVATVVALANAILDKEKYAENTPQSSPTIQVVEEVPHQAPRNNQADEPSKNEAPLSPKKRRQRIKAEKNRVKYARKAALSKEERLGLAKKLCESAQTLWGADALKAYSNYCRATRTRVDIGLSKSLSDETICWHIPADLVGQEAVDEYKRSRSKISERTKDLLLSGKMLLCGATGLIKSTRLS